MPLLKRRHGRDSVNLAVSMTETPGDAVKLTSYEGAVSLLKPRNRNFLIGTKPMMTAIGKSSLTNVGKNASVN